MTRTTWAKGTSKRQGAHADPNSLTRLCYTSLIIGGGENPPYFTVLRKTSCGASPAPAWEGHREAEAALVQTDDCPTLTDQTLSPTGCGQIKVDDFLCKAQTSAHTDRPVGQMPTIHGRPPPPPQDKSSRGSVDTTKTRSGPQRVRTSSGERPIGAAKGKQSDTEALCQPPHPRRRWRDLH